MINPYDYCRESLPQAKALCSWAWSVPSLGRYLSLGLSLIMALIFSLPGYALVEVDQLSSPELSNRYRQLIEEYRCPKCQNQNLAGSDSPISSDLRREIRRMLEEGASDGQISDYLVARYGDFILYRPRLQKSTYLLWLGPGMLLLVALSVAGLVIARQRSKVVALEVRDKEESTPDSLSEIEQQQLDELLAGSTPAGHIDGDKKPS